MGVLGVWTFLSDYLKNYSFNTKKLIFEIVKCSIMEIIWYISYLFLVICSGESSKNVLVLNHREDTAFKDVFFFMKS